MGYEIEMFVGEISSGGGEGIAYLSDIGRVNLCKPGYDSYVYETSMGAQERHKKYGEITAVYFYGDDGNTRITEDAYGSPLLALNIELVVEALAIDVTSGYPRFVMALNLLETTQQFYPDAKVVLYGY